MSRTTFKNASGLPNPAQVTSARDLVTLGRAIHDRFPKLYRYFGTREFDFAGSAYRNHNKLLGRVEGVDGIKTGYTRASGFNLLTSVKAEGRHVVAVVLGGRSGRSRDAQMASLVENNMERAYAGRRTAPVVAEVEIADAPAVRPRQALALAETPLPAVLPRPRAAPVAEIITQAPPQPLPQVRVTAAPVTAAIPVPSLRWVVGPQPAERGTIAGSARLSRNDTGRNDTGRNDSGRPVPPASVPFTNSVSQKPVDKEDETKLPAARKVTAVPVQAAPAARPEANKPEAARPAAAIARSGWVIQLAAAESEGKARQILDQAKAKNKSVLSDAEAFTERVNKGEATLYRARFAGFDSDDAQSACKALKRSGFSCFAQRI